ncbi:hypothetical protein [Rhodococcus sp. NPDC127528]|uniref:hypothetical protein n=1 Tax=unclassified Rhodococcus (in: high G+C Gram-positive bacteria) TaxID=192944 RepID=UPI003639149D
MRTLIHAVISLIAVVMVVLWAAGTASAEVTVTYTTTGSVVTAKVQGVAANDVCHLQLTQGSTVYKSASASGPENNGETFYTLTVDVTGLADGKYVAKVACDIGTNGQYLPKNAQVITVTGGQCEPMSAPLRNANSCNQGGGMGNGGNGGMSGLSGQNQTGITLDDPIGALGQILSTLLR